MDPASLSEEEIGYELALRHVNNLGALPRSEEPFACVISCRKMRLEASSMIVPPMSHVSSDETRRSPSRASDTIAINSLSG